MGPGLWESFYGLLVRCQVWVPISFGGIGFFFMEDCVPFDFLRNWVLVVSYLCSRFHIFDRPILEEYVFQVEGGPHMFQSCLRVAQDGLPLIVREMRPFLKSLTITSAPSLHAYLMDIHHDTSLRFIFEDDSIFLASRTHIRFCLGKGAGLWLVVRPFIVRFASHTLFSPQHCVFCHGLI